MSRCLSSVVVVILDLLEQEAELAEILVFDEHPLLRRTPHNLLPEESAENVDGALDANGVDVGSGDVAVNILLAHHNIRMYHAVEHSLVEPIVGLLGSRVPRVEKPGRLVLFVSEEDDAGRPPDPAGVNGQQHCHRSTSESVILLCIAPVSAVDE